MPPFSTVWQYYTTEQWTDNDGRVRRTSTCNFCNKTYRSNATKMTLHLVKQCRSCPENIRVELGQLVENGSHDEVEVALVIPQPVENETSQGQAVVSPSLSQSSLNDPKPAFGPISATRTVKSHRWFKDTKAVWKHFVTETHKDEHGNSKSTSYCMYCNLRYTFPNVTKMRKHLLVKCRQCPQSVIDEVGCRSTTTPIIHQWNRSSSNPSTSTSPDQQAPSTSAQQSPPSQLSQLIYNRSSLPTTPSVPTALATPSGVAAAKKMRLEHPNLQIVNRMQPMRTNPGDNQIIDAAVARAVYSSNTPLNFAENQHWKEAFKLLRATYTPPTKGQLTRQLLDEEYERVTGKILEKVNKCACVAIIADGWADKTGQSRINFTVATPQPVFLKSIEAKESECTPAYIAEVISGVIQGIGAAKVLLVLTDNTSNNMRAAWELIQQQYPHITTAGCVGYSLAGLIDDIMKLETLQNLSMKATSVVQSIKDVPSLYDALKMKQEENYGKDAKMLHLPGRSQQGGALLMFESLLACKDSCMEIVSQNYSGLNDEVSSIVLDNEHFWLPIESCMDILRPIALGLTKVTSSKALLSDVPQEFCKIMNDISVRLAASPLTSQEQISAQQAMEERKTYCCFPIHHASNLLDPRYRGQGLNEEDLAGAMDLIIKLSMHLGLDPGKVMANLAEFRAQEGRLWSVPSVWAAAQHTDPFIWWKGMCAVQKLMPIASNLLSIPPSAAVSMKKRCSPGDNYSSLKAAGLSEVKKQKIIAIRSNLHLFREGYDDETEDSVADDEESSHSQTMSDSEEDNSASVAVPIHLVELKKEIE